jgi:hypothetical protein
VRGRLIIFRIDRQRVCAVRTGADGSAVCMITNKSQQEAAAREGFDAYFRGDATFKASTAHGDVGLAP